MIQQKTDHPSYIFQDDEVEDDSIYMFSWGLKHEGNLFAPNGFVHEYSMRGTKAEVVEMMLSLKDNPRVVNPNLVVRDRKPLESNEHYHVRDGVRLDHTWEECPDRDDRKDA